jgi:DNA replication ATP-dependent helicase Dna2
VFEGQDWIVDRFPSDMTSEASHTALYDFLVAPDDDRKRAILGLSAAKESGTAETGDCSGLNESQRRAIQRASSCRTFHLIWGPPGTGKTRVIPEIVRRVSGRVLLGAFTNTAVDKMLMALVAADRSVRFLRIGRASDSPELAAMLENPSDCFSEDLALKHRSVRALRAAMDSIPIVAATAHRACAMPYLRRSAFEMAIVDEAGQLTEPLTLGLILRGRRFVLIGDDRQLPPVVRTRELARSMFERLKSDGEKSGSGVLTLLDTQYRMHPQIMAVSNRLFYEGRLRTGVQHDERLPPDGAPVLMVPVRGAPAAAGGDERINEEEAGAVVRLVQHYLQDFRVGAESIGVISPFRAQVVLLRKLLHDTGVAVDTVERFQGGERDIMILSFVRSQGRGFVFDERRFNVAITRARRKLVLVAHPELFRNSRYEWICTFTETPRTVGTT